MKQKYDIEWLTERFDYGEALKYIFFWGHTKKNGQDVGNFCFSQWFESPFEVNGVKYKTTEHWMMAQKALLFENNDIYEQIINCEKPGEAKEFGRRVLGFDEMIWNKHRFEIVRLGNIHKFNQNPDFGKYLLKTSNRILVEASPVDTIWGIGLTKDSRDVENIYTWRGLNLLGFALMEVRDFLKDFGFFSFLEVSLTPPWVKYPKIDAIDMFWRMGEGEQYIIEFSKAYEELSDREKVIFKLSNPEPLKWRGFYEE